MYVICAGMRGEGAAWPYEVVARLLETHWKGLRLGSMTGEAFAAFDEVWADRPRWSVLRAHEEDTRFAASIVEGRAIAVHVRRDLRDVIFATVRERRVALETLLRKGAIHRIVRNDRFWSTLPGVLCLRDEALTADPIAAVEQLAAHLGLPLAPIEAAEVAHAVSRHHQPHAGTWRSLATPRQLLIMARFCDPWLEAHGYPADTRDSLIGNGWTDLPRRICDRLHAEAELAAAWLADMLRRVPELVWFDPQHDRPVAVAETEALAPATVQLRFDASTPGRIPGRPHDPPRPYPASIRRAMSPGD